MQAQSETNTADVVCPTCLIKTFKKVFVKSPQTLLYFQCSLMKQSLQSSMEILYMPIVTANISNFTLQDSDAIQIENYINCASNYRGFFKWFLDSNNDKKKKVLLQNKMYWCSYQMLKKSFNDTLKTPRLCSVFVNSHLVDEKVTETNWSTTFVFT